MTESKKYKGYNDIKCIWMICGSIDYKICDKNFDCEDCEFDKQMLSGLKTKGNVQDEIENMFNLVQHTVSFTHPYYHFNRGQMARNFLSNIYYLGLEPFIGKFIDKHSLLKYSTSSNVVKKGEPILNINNGWGEVNIQSPFNFNFVEKLDLKNIFSKDLHWFAIIEVDRDEILGYSLDRKRYFEKLHEDKIYLMNQLKTMQEVVMPAESSAQAGITMYDGGVFLKNWSDILGKNNYKNLLEKFFS
jgi:hypothetical protein